jgi:DNA-binding protein H-NS
MESDHRYRRARAAALFTAQGLVAQYSITQAELLELERQLAARHRSLAEPIRQAWALMDAHDIDIDDLIDAEATAQAPKITHRHPDPTRSETWDGQGPQPEWLRRALLVEGLRPADLRVTASEDA